jgi:NTP pyrophosphatase (non-canonical NTP hydrolase)
MNDKIRETLVITQEECAEVIQEISKIFRFGIDEMHKSGVVHREKLNQEVGDLLCMIDLLVEQGLLNQQDLDAAKEKKIAKLKIFSKIFVDNDHK